jgi:hypothetical protein
MALNFPNNPDDGDLYPNPAPPGVVQYTWSEAKGTWLAVFQGIRSVEGIFPVVVAGAQNEPIIEMPAAGPTNNGYMSAADKAKLDALPNPTDPSPEPLVWVRLENIAPLFNGVNVSYKMVAENGDYVTPSSASYTMISINGEVLTAYVQYNLIGDNLIFSSAPKAGDTFSGVALI